MYHYNHFIQIDLPKSVDQSVKLVTCVVDSISDDQLLELAFTVYMKRAAFLLTGTNIIVSDPVEEQVKYAVQVLWTLLEKSSHPIRQKFAQYVSSESQLIVSTLKTMCIYLESKGEEIGMIYCSLVKEGPWAVHLTFGSGMGVG